MNASLGHEREIEFIFIADAREFHCFLFHFSAAIQLK